MTATNRDQPKTVFDQIKAGLADSTAFSQGKASMETTELPAPPAEDARPHRAKRVEGLADSDSNQGICG